MEDYGRFVGQTIWVKGLRGRLESYSVQPDRVVLNFPWGVVTIPPTTVVKFLCERHNLIHDGVCGVCTDAYQKQADEAEEDRAEREWQTYQERLNEGS